RFQYPLAFRHRPRVQGREQHEWPAVSFLWVMFRFRKRTQYGKRAHFIRRTGGVFTIEFQCLFGTFAGLECKAEHDFRADRVQAVLKRRDNPKVTATTAQTPE